VAREAAKSREKAHQTFMVEHLRRFAFVAECDAVNCVAVAYTAGATQLAARVHLANPLGLHRSEPAIWIVHR
jgi:tRNA(Ser,Leu) C12 N-acetylase TAN1